MMRSLFTHIFLTRKKGPGKPNCRYKNRKKDPASQVAGTGIGKGTRQNKLPVQELKKGPGKPNAGTRIEKGVR